MTLLVDNILNEIEQLPDSKMFGKVIAVKGLLVEINGTHAALSVGDRCYIHSRNKRIIPCEVVAFNGDKTLLMPYSRLEGVGPGCKAELSNAAPVIYPDISWLGRIINPMGEPVDGKGPLVKGKVAYPIQNSPPLASTRNRVAGKVDLGVRAINTFVTLCKGQRIGIFSGSGVGKSSLISMMARHTALNVSVVGLIGERGREAKEFIEDDLGEEGLARSTIVLATSDESPMMRRQAAYTTITVAEYFRDLGVDVLCMMDSITRFAMAQREISLSAGEPPANKGYTPTVFAELPKLLERAGPGTEKGSITGLFTVLVEGDDHNEPISDAARGILDGHIVLDRAIAERGRFPSINILRSLSRTMPDCNTERENNIVGRARKLLSTYEDMAELIRLGAYRKGSNPEVDEAIHFYPAIENFIAQRKDEKTTLEEGYEMLANATSLRNIRPPQNGEQQEDVMQGLTEQQRELAEQQHAKMMAEQQGEPSQPESMGQPRQIEGAAQPSDPQQPAE